jgi:DNA-directed RNA polymerase subunit H (RpoH/RPB5)
MANNKNLGYKFYLPIWKPDNIDTIFKIKVNVLKMLETQGYDISHEQYYIQDTPVFSESLVFSNNSEYQSKKDMFWNNISRDQNMSVYQAMSSDYIKRDNTNKTVAVRYIKNLKGNKTITKDVIRELTFSMTNEKQVPYYDRLIVIAFAGILVDSRKILENLQMKVDIFDSKELIINPAESYLNPTYRLLTPSEKEEFLANEIKMSQLPQFNANDPIVRYNDWKKGDIIEIIRNNYFVSSIAKQSLYYRKVSSANKVTKKRKK